MKIRVFRTVAARLAGLSIVLAVIGVQAATPADTSAPTLDRLLATCASQRDVFLPLGDEDLARARAELTEAVARLEARLNRAGPGGDDWRAYLKSADLEEQLAAETPDLPVLDAVHAKFAAGYNGLGLVWFIDVRQALRHYLSTARAIGSPTIKSQYENLLDALPEHLRKYDAEPTTEAALVIGTVVGWLEEAGQADQLVDEIRRYFSQPNLNVRISSDLVSAAVSQRIDDVTAVRDVILRTSIRGTGHMVGQLNAELVPSEDRAEIHAVVQGVIESDTVGTNGPARIHATGITPITAQKSILIDAEHIWSEPAKSKATTKTKIRGVSAGRSGGFIERFARKQVYKKKCQAEQIGSRHAEQQMNRRMDDEAGQLVTDANIQFDEKFRAPLVERKLFPELLQFATTASHLKVVALQGGPHGLGASTEPPEQSGQTDLVVRVHESLVNNLMESALSGMILNEELILEDAERLFGEVPERLQPDPNELPWGILFARRQPVSVTFADGQFTLTLRGRRFTQGDDSYPGMNVSVTYALRGKGDRLRAVRQGDLRVYPQGFKPGEGRTLSVREQVLRSLLERRFGTIFEAELKPEDILLPEQWGRTGNLALSRWESTSGWMLLEWKLNLDEETSEPVAETAAVEGAMRS